MGFFTSNLALAEEVANPTVTQPIQQDIGGVAPLSATSQITGDPLSQLASSLGGGSSMATQPLSATPSITSDIANLFGSSPLAGNTYIPPNSGSSSIQPTAYPYQQLSSSSPSYSSPTDFSLLSSLSSGPSLTDSISNLFGSTGTTSSPTYSSYDAYAKSNSLFNFGNESLLGFSSDTSKALSGLGLLTGNQNLGQAGQLAGLTGNKLYDYAVKDIPYAGLLNNDFSRRGIMNQAGQMTGLNQYGFMPAMDYLQGVNNYGGLFSTVGGLVAGPLGSLIGGALAPTAGWQEDGSWLGAYNENISGQAADYARSFNLEPGTPGFDLAMQGYSYAMQNNPTFSQAENERVMAEQQRAEADQMAYSELALDPGNISEAVQYGTQNYGQEGDSISIQDGQTFRSEEGNWNLSAQEQADQQNWEDTGSSTGDDFGSWDSDAASDMDADSGWSGADSDWGDSSSDSGGGDSGGDGGSYIATAATQALGEEGLTIFEGWRDYMMDVLPTFKSTYGRYRVTAPKIVAAIDKKDNSENIYNYIWDMHLKPIFDLITEDKDSDKALKDYKIMVKELQNKFLKKKEKV